MMARPAGAPFWGESLPPGDWSTLSGSASYGQPDGTINPPTTYAGQGARAWGEGDGRTGDAFVRVPAAAKLLWLFDTPDYLQAGDTAVVSWVVRTRGSGSISLTNDRDVTYDYSAPAGPVVGTATVSGSTWTEHDFPTSAFTVAELVDGDGGFRLAIDVSGAVDIDVVQLRIWPPGGPLGSWSAPIAQANRNLVTNGLSERFGVEGNGYTDWPSAWADAAGDLTTASVANNGAALAPVMPVRADAPWTSNLDGSIHIYTWEFAGGYLSFDAEPGNERPTVTGTVGVDYIRRPDRTWADEQAYWVWASDARPSVIGWLNAVLNYTESRNAPAGYAYDVAPTVSAGVVDYIEPVDGFNTPQPTPVAWPVGVSDAFLALTDEGSTGVLPFAPTGDRFSLIFDHSWFHTEPADPMITAAGTGVAVGAAATFVVGSETAPLTAVVAMPPFLVWTPAAAPISWVRQKSRPDGYGTAPRRQKSYSSRTISNRQRGIR